MMNKILFQQEQKQIQSQIEIVEKLNKVNQHLQSNNWIFIHPYSQGGDIDVLNRLLTESKNPNEEVIQFFGSKFFDLRGTIHFIEGFYATRPFLKEFVPFIKESVVLCLQKDFKGAISVLIPVIEGTLRNYLISKKGEHKKEEIKIKELLKALDMLTIEYVEAEKGFIRKRNHRYVQANIYMDANQEKQILKKHRYYFELWMLQFRSFIKNNLYLNTKTNRVTDNLNRHLIFHGLDENIDFSFSNFLRIFNSLNFLSWSIGLTTEECSILSEVHEEKVKSLWKNYWNILITSEALTEYKNNIYSESVESFSKYLRKPQRETLNISVARIKVVLKQNDFLTK